ncbi:MAG: AAA family ATPase [Sulfurimonas sp.]|nr:AAA family ATPase [Sulfurimonas sp.]
MEIYTKEQLKYFNDDERLNILKKSWGISSDEPIQIIGDLSRTLNLDAVIIYRLNNIRLNNGKHIEYPISDLDNKNVSDIYVPRSIEESIKTEVNSGKVILVTAMLELSSEAERTRRTNPLYLSAIVGTAHRLHVITNNEILNDDNGEFLVKDSILNHYVHKNIKEIQENINNVKIQKDELDKDFKQLNQQNEILKKNINSLEVEITEREEHKKTISNEIEELKILAEKEKELMGEKLEKFRSFAKSKATTLLNLELIEQEEYDDIMMIESNHEDMETYVNFHEELDSNFSEAVSHIQSYLFKNEIAYPRYIIEDFFALIKTNDLIVLAGESGSGKTNLVKSFAKAVGGESIIIPVKPNWTSSEDLLGYYNPLEKKYLSTPFLDALIKANKNPNKLYLICLDEMNLARVEYYFADFLSLLEERNGLPEIKLYSEDESSHVLSEFKNVLDLIGAAKERYQKNHVVDFVKMLQDEEINNELKRVFGFSDKDSLIKYHSDLRRMISGIINTPSSIVFPKNVRIIGAINIDETTHYLSPKILDRAHIMKFGSPLLYDWDSIENEINKDRLYDIDTSLKLKFDIDDFGTRSPYPSFNKENEFCKNVVELTKKYFSPLGIEVGLRTIRQGLNYKKIFIEQGSNESFVINNFVMHKILPKLTFDGSKKVMVDGYEKEKITLLDEFRNELKEYIAIDENTIEYKTNNAIHELEEIVRMSRNNNNIVNYWA